MYQIRPKILPMVSLHTMLIQCAIYQGSCGYFIIWISPKEKKLCCTVTSQSCYILNMTKLCNKLIAYIQMHNTFLSIISSLTKPTGWQCWWQQSLSRLAYLKQICNYPIICHLENWSFWILVNSHNCLWSENSTLIGGSVFKFLLTIY